MQFVRNRAWSAMVLVLLTVGTAYSQPVPRTNPNEKSEEKQNLSPGAAKTKEEVEKNAKAPVDLAPMPMAAPIDPRTYVIGPEDILSIHVWREQELSSAVQVRPDGKITLPLIGELEAAGQTPEGLKTKIVEALQEYIVKPEVIVSIRSVLSRKYYITGEVNRPGPFPLVVPTTVLEALSNAGGFREFANTKKITILRKGKLLKFNHNEVVKGKKMEQNIMLENGDFVNVP
jgi:polysaccharide biosynthesis/export protein